MAENDELKSKLEKMTEQQEESKDDPVPENNQAAAI